MFLIAYNYIFFLLHIYYDWCFSCGLFCMCTCYETHMTILVKQNLVLDAQNFFLDS